MQCVSEKNPHSYIWNNSVETESISILYKYLEEILHQKIVNLPTSSELCCCTTLWNANVALLQCMSYYN